MSDRALQEALILDGASSVSTDERNKVCRGRAKRILRDMNPVQQAMALDSNPRIAGRCPRRAGKSFAAMATALATGEANPGSIVVLISLTLKMTKRNYWGNGAPSGLHEFNRKYGLGLQFNAQELRWEHENGSVGYLLGADTVEALEHLRGFEADLYIIDECKSFAPSILRELIDDVIMPQRASRDGRVMLIGTPGSILSGPFYEATNPLARTEPTERHPNGLATAYPAGNATPEILQGRNKRNLWSFHHWTLQDNVGKDELLASKGHLGQWAQALIEKEGKGWADEHPSWQREYLGEWVPSSEGLVFNYVEAKMAHAPGYVNWLPQRSPDNTVGLPVDKGPWRFVWGLDIGFEDPTALVVAAYSTTSMELRHVATYAHQHLLLDGIEDLLKAAAVSFGQPEAVYADTAGLGKMLVETLKGKGYLIDAADKQQKNDFIELLNADFAAGRIKILAGSKLEDQLLSVSWDLKAGGRKELARSGKLREDRDIPNDITDAFIYLYRGCYHHFAKPAVQTIPVDSVQWHLEWEKKELAAARAEWALENSSPFSRYRGPQRAALPYGRTPLGLDRLKGFK